VALYLVFMLIIGFYTSRRPITTLRDYALGTGGLVTYSPLALLGTLLATDFGAGSTLGDSAKVFTLGLGFVIIKFTLPVSYCIVAQFAAPRLRRFIDEGLGQHAGGSFLSVGDVIRYFYGPRSQVITGVAGFLFCMGAMGAQISAIGWLLHYCLGWSHGLGITLAFGVVVAYTAAGGIRAVVATDLWQMFVILLVLPFLTNLALCKFAGTSGWALFNPSVYHSLLSHLPPTHFSLIPVGFHALDYSFLLIIMLWPFFTPPVFQRILMCRGVQQVQFMFQVGAVAQVFLCSMVVCAGLAACVQMPDVAPAAALLEVIKSYTQGGVFGICLVGLLAAIMSTADSLLNAASICLSHDVCKPLMGSSLSEAGELRIARVSTVFIGLLSAVVALYFTDIRDLLISCLAIWGPAIVVPLWAGILGYRASGRVFLVAVLAGQLAYWSFPYLLPSGAKVSATLPAMLANGLAFWAARKWEQGQKPPASPRRGPNIAGKAGKPSSQLAPG
jgi:Na+/proline symporter